MVCLLDVEDVRQEMPIAELSRPYRAFKEKQSLKGKHPQGRKKKNERHIATYHNWHTPFLWSQIASAAKHPSVGWKMSSTEIVNLLKRQDPMTFGGLARTTVESWIDRSGDKPKWSDRALEMASEGNDHSLGSSRGKKGIFVRDQPIKSIIMTLTSPCRHNFPLWRKQSLIG